MLLHLTFENCCAASKVIPFGEKIRIYKSALADEHCISMGINLRGAASTVKRHGEIFERKL